MQTSPAKSNHSAPATHARSRQTSPLPTPSTINSSRHPSPAYATATRHALRSATSSPKTQTLDVAPFFLPHLPAAKPRICCLPLQTAWASKTPPEIVWACQTVATPHTTGQYDLSFALRDALARLRASEPPDDYTQRALHRNLAQTTCWTDSRGFDNADLCTLLLGLVSRLFRVCFSHLCPSFRR
ncbi:hypothetical protein CDD81_4246 [Ophiocordyceps australis]|uniref:Uncharacterized protein n=1 Tax=Ophiocordyceps australis TaxID=1399860 RepID=A0A2C5Y567_9HYPO|nr:hypothetical protein CDD81_4246 [Ophiocordyceps australis]